MFIFFPNPIKSLVDFQNILLSVLQGLKSSRPAESQIYPSSSLNPWKLGEIAGLLQWRAHVVIQTACVVIRIAHFALFSATFVFLSSKTCNSRKITNTVKNGDRCSKLKHINIQNDATFLVSSQGHPDQVGIREGD